MSRVMRAPRPSPWRWVALGVVGGALIVAAFWLVSPQFGVREPTPATLVRDLAKHRPTLERLHQMLAEDDALLEVSRTYTRPQDAEAVGVTSERLRDYRALMRQAGVLSLRRNPEFAAGSPAVYEVWGKGTLGRKWGYVYSLGKPYGAVVEDIAAQPPTTGMKPIFQPIEDAWFIYYLCAAGCE